MFKRGPQRDESAKFTLSQFQDTVELHDSFLRTSSFYYNQKDEKWFDKECKVKLGYFNSKGKWTKVSSTHVNMAELVDQGEADIIFNFELMSKGVTAFRLSTKMRIDSGTDTIAQTIVNRV